MLFKKVYGVKEQWDKDQVALVQTKIFRDASIFFMEVKFFSEGTDQERYEKALRYYNERVSYIYTRKGMFSYLEPIPFTLVLFSIKTWIGITVKKQQLLRIDQDSPLPDQFKNGLFITKKR